MTARAPVPTAAQAKMIAWTWADDRRHEIGGYIDATRKALIRNGWLVATDEKSRYQNGSEFTFYKLGPTALSALEDYLRNARMRKTDAEGER